MGDLDRLQTFFSMFSQYRFRIPDYQRGYAWGDDQWRELLEDISTLTEDNEHFTGLLVLHENHDPAMRIKTKGMYKPVYDIVDGQQRLTTIVILLNEIRLDMLELNTDDLIEIANDIRETYLYEPGYGNLLVPKLVLDSNNHDYFVHNILEMNGKNLLGARILSHENLQNAQQYFRRHLREQHQERGDDYVNWLETLYGKIVNQMKVMVYRLRTDADAGVVFEAMNSRGKRPNQMDLVKNYLLYLASKLEPHSRDQLSQEINQAWTIIFDQLNAAGRADDEDTLLEMHWLTIHDHNRKRWASEPEKSSHVKKYFKPLLVRPDLHTELHARAEKYVRGIQNVAVAFSDLSNPTRSGAFKIFDSDPTLKSSVIKSSEKLVRLGILRPFTPILIAIRLRFADDAEKYLEVVRLCEKYAFRVFRIANGRTNSSEAVLFRLANQIYLGRLNYEYFLEEFKRDLFSRCKDVQLEQSFSPDHPNPWYGRSGLKYFLYEFEEHLYGNQAPVVNWETIINGRDKTIEHILPQNPEDDGYWAERFSPEQIEKHKHLLGNLTLTEDNRKLGRKSFIEKKGKPGQSEYCYASSNLKVERELAAVNDWTVDEIEKRQQRQAKWAIRRWHVDPPGHNYTDTLPPKYTMERILAVAHQHGVGEELRVILDTVRPYGIYPTPKIWCVLLSPPRNHLLALATIRPEAGRLKVGVWHENWPKHLAISEDEVYDLLGEEKWRTLDITNLDKFIAGLVQLLDRTGGKT